MYVVHRTWAETAVVLRGTSRVTTKQHCDHFAEYSKTRCVYFAEYSKTRCVYFAEYSKTRCVYFAEYSKTRCVEQRLLRVAYTTRAQWACSEAENSAITATVKRLGLLK